MSEDPIPIPITSPAILIGCARSGTTMLRRVLNAHAEIQMFGETDFLAFRLWREVFENHFWFNIGKSSDRRKKRMKDARHWIDPERVDELERDRRRIAQATARLFVDVLDLDPSKSKVWGFKEIKTGAPLFQYDWKVMDHVFPHAKWIHLVRNPFAQVRSAVLWNGEELTLDHLVERLSQWCRVTDLARGRSGAGPYHLMKYESLLEDGRVELEKLLGFLGLDPDPDSLSELEVVSLATSHRPLESEGGSLIRLSTGELQSHPDFPDRLGELMELYHYEWPEAIELVDLPASGARGRRDPLKIKIAELKEKNDALRSELEQVRSRLQQWEASPLRRLARLAGNPKKLFRKKR